MYRQRSDDKYVHSALFKDVATARAARCDVEEAGLSSERVALVILHEDKAVEAPARPPENDGRRGLMLGFFSGAIAGLGVSLLLTQLGVLSGYFEQTALCGLFGGMIIGGLGG